MAGPERRKRSGEEVPEDLEPRRPLEEGGSQDPRPGDPVQPEGLVQPPGDEEPRDEEPEESPPSAARQRRLSGWVERRAKSVVASLYREQADDLESRARRAVSSLYDENADDLEERAVRALRRALQAESDRIQEVIEHAVAVKKREVRLSLAVLVLAALVYLLLDWYGQGRFG